MTKGKNIEGLVCLYHGVSPRDMPCVKLASYLEPIVNHLMK